MINATSKVLGYICAPVGFILKKGLSHYIFDKLQERNPLQSSPGYDKQVKALTKNIVVLKGIRKQLNERLKQGNDLQNKLKNLNDRVAYLDRQLHYLKLQEQGLSFLKWAAPCNLILPGSGAVIRTTAYALKTFQTINFYFKYKSQEELRQTLSEMAFSRIVSVTTEVAYNTIHSLRQHITYQNFRSFFYY